ncbi:hypothetical protein LEMLEM_LOCUS10312, partial [Lemmus lemmus]
ALARAPSAAGSSTAAPRRFQCVCKESKHSWISQLEGTRQYSYAEETLFKKDL